MKTKKAAKTNVKSRIIFFAITLTYNILLGLHLKDFLVLSPMLSSIAPGYDDAFTRHRTDVLHYRFS